jgi:uncharacterized protein (TIGR02453 family)
MKNNKMIKQDILVFLKDLSKNNSKEWFDLNRNRYQQIRKDFMDFVAVLIHDLSQMDNQIAYLEPKNVVFRINRDIRFSNDKSPYKTNMGAFICPGGKNSGAAGYYLHIEPDNCFAAGGMHMPPSASLKLVRSAIFDNLDAFKSIIDKKSFKQVFSGIQGEKLKTAPQGYPKDHPDIDLVRYKSYTVFSAMDDKDISRPDLLKNLMNVYTEMKPLNDFLNRAVDV